MQTRKYFIAAVPEVWDYVPYGGEMCGGSKVNFSDNAKTFVEPGPDRIGNKYLKALYVEYTDATFKTRKVSICGQLSVLWANHLLPVVWLCRSMYASKGAVAAATACPESVTSNKVVVGLHNFAVLQTPWLTLQLSTCIHTRQSPASVCSLHKHSSSFSSLIPACLSLCAEACSRVGALGPARPHRAWHRG
jgi:hypothetical protein